MCCVRVWARFSDHPCGKRAKVEREGKHYCGTHDPQKRIDRDVEMRAKWKRDDLVRAAERAVRDARDALVQSATDDVHGGSGVLSEGTLRAVVMLDEANAALAKARS
jgi:hypothetical protein